MGQSRLFAREEKTSEDELKIDKLNLMIEFGIRTLNIHYRRRPFPVHQPCIAETLPKLENEKGAGNAIEMSLSRRRRSNLEQK